MRRSEQPSDAKSDKTMPTFSTTANVGCSRIIPGFKHGRLRRYDASDMREHAKHNGRTPPIPATLKLDMLTTKLETPEIQSHLSGVLLHKKRRQSQPESEESAEKEDTNNYRDRSFGQSMDIDSIRHNRDQGVANFEALLRDSNLLDQNFGTNEAPKIAGGLAQNVRGLSSPAPMRNQLISPRKATVPDNKASNTHPHENEVPLEPMYHGQEVHLVFKIPKDQTIQAQELSMRHKGVHENPFSRRVRCDEVRPYASSEDGDTLRIIGHTMDGILRGGDCVCFAPLDGKVLRMQLMSEKLTSSSKIDVRAKFLIIRVPDRVPVTSTSKFYLQSLYETVGFLRSRWETHSGCLVIYFDENTNDKVEPIQFFKRY
ncbi:hypothetical protein PsorP6_000251 [Peronosclerospora sorghi]|uniref:Uncharacterized protein n=1 Tax=Peronosclerospora sorghi TaxID=230839 RepID=A0ACC0WVY9_9STRA|nr:hypothetical protein PsorP6_000251 [Peronosclerospora sorghi]